MPQVCSQCQRVNPPEAAYCYHDGVLLAGHSADGSAVRQGAQPFPNQFVFPSGVPCRNFDQLAMACQQNWEQAVDLLKQGYLASFLGGLGRADLALAAQEAARFPDHNRGLDQLLSKLPTQVLQPPKLQVEPTDVNLGILPMGTDRTFELHLDNLGMRLLYGSVVSDSKWLTLGESPGNAQKLFQFGADAVIPVQIRGQFLRAGAKALEGHLVIESNGGMASVRVRADVPVKPFAEGVLAGAVSPRQIGEKAHAAPKAAAALFEKGAVAHWFTENGWQYPVQGPSASGLGAIQQFFEAYGWAKAPKLEVKPATLNLKGQVGQTLQTAVTVFSQERRPIYAYGTCDQPWLDVARAKFEAKNPIAHLPVHVRVPNRPGETLQANIRVTGNGNQRFTVPLALAVEGTPTNPFAFSASDLVPVVSAEPPIVVEAIEPFAAVMALEPAEELVEVTAATPAPTAGVMSAVPVPPPLPSSSAPPPLPVAPVPVSAMPVTAVPVSAVPMPAVPMPAVPMPAVPMPAVPMPAMPMPAMPVSEAMAAISVPAAPAPPRASSGARPTPPPLPGAAPAPALAASASPFATNPFAAAEPAPAEAPPRSHRPETPVWAHLVPLGVLALALIAVMLRDLISHPADADAIDSTKHVDLLFDFGEGKEFSQTLSFGVFKPDVQNRRRGVWLTFDEKGLTNSTVVRIDGIDKLFGDLSSGGRWQATPEWLYWGDEGPRRLRNTKKGLRGSWNFVKEQVLVTQTVELIAGEPVEAYDNKRLIDTVLVRYRIENHDRVPHKVALRFLLDTLIGDNDEPFFTVPGIDSLVDAPRDFAGQVPDFIQALEKPNIKEPGTVALVNLRPGGKLEAPVRLSLTHWPGKSPGGKPFVPFQVPLTQSFAKDSAVAIYWSEQDVKPKQARELGFTYGLYSLKEAGRIAVTIAGDLSLKGEMTVVALVNDPKTNETLTLRLPPELRLVEGQETQLVPPAAKGRPSPVTWRVRSVAEGTFPVEARSSTNDAKVKRVRIRASGLF